MKVEAPAKVNLALDILGSRPDGYHELDMIMAEIGLADSLEIERSDRDVILCDKPLPPCNTLTKTLEVLREQYGLKHSYKIVLHKRVPEQAGLGGGSADAAALIKALNTMEHLNLSVEQMMEAGAKVGADVPFCILGGYARVKGIGEQCTPIPCDWKIPVLLIKPEQGISTPACFAAWDAMDSRPCDIDIVEDALRKKDPALLYQTMINTLEPVAADQLPDLYAIKEDMNECGIVRVMMTGSGSTMMGFCIDEELLDKAQKTLSNKYPFVVKTTIGQE